ncbi:hypothetical protein [Candidatus Ichthyocystis hellenicum]|uniref:hypothetical protein n=1 Tax=Candidatus Ichthyocystis hellenicum TaxID=1561003 RepID=UPI000B8A5442|nr:hypothetical protein [Candidatus Ichthyocystis hellenicum]
MQNINNSSYLEIYIRSINLDDDAHATLEMNNSESSSPVVGDGEESSSCAENRSSALNTMSVVADTSDSNTTPSDNCFRGGNSMTSPLVIVRLPARAGDIGEVQVAPESRNRAATACFQLSQSGSPGSPRDIIVAGANRSEDRSASGLVGNTEDVRSRDTDAPDYPPPPSYDACLEDDAVELSYYPQWYGTMQNQREDVGTRSVRRPAVRGGDLGENPGCCPQGICQHIVLSCVIALSSLLFTILSIIIVFSVSNRGGRPNPAA